jgi:hypothetical protein
MVTQENRSAVIIASGARVANNSSDDAYNPHSQGAVIIIDMTVVPGVDTVTFTVEGFDPASQKYYPILVSAAIVAVSTVVLRVFPGAVVAANLAASDVIPLKWRVRAVHSAASSFTYSVGANMIAIG